MLFEMICRSTPTVCANVSTRCSNVRGEPSTRYVLCFILKAVSHLRLGGCLAFRGVVAGTTENARHPLSPRAIYSLHKWLFEASRGAGASSTVLGCHEHVIMILHKRGLDLRLLMSRHCTLCHLGLHISKNFSRMIRMIERRRQCHPVPPPKPSLPPSHDYEACDGSSRNFTLLMCAHENSELRGGPASHM